MESPAQHVPQARQARNPALSDDIGRRQLLAWMGSEILLAHLHQAFRLAGMPRPNDHRRQSEYVGLALVHGGLCTFSGDGRASVKQYRLSISNSHCTTPCSQRSPFAASSLYLRSNTQVDVAASRPCQRYVCRPGPPWRHAGWYRCAAMQHGQMERHWRLKLVRKGRKYDMDATKRQFLRRGHDSSVEIDCCIAASHATLDAPTTSSEFS